MTEWLVNILYLGTKVHKTPCKCVYLLGQTRTPPIFSVSDITEIDQTIAMLPRSMYNPNICMVICAKPISSTNCHL